MVKYQAIHKFNHRQQIVLYYLGLCTQNPELKEVDFEPSPKRGRDKISMQRTQKKASQIMQPGFTHMNPAIREGDLERSTKRGNNKTGALISLY